MKRKRRLVVANWKMHPKSLVRAQKLFKGVAKKVASVRGADVVICPPNIYLGLLKKSYTGTRVKFGAQDISPQKGEGSYTGEVSGAQLHDSGVRYVIVGHSERRRMGETDEIVSYKVGAALKARLIPIVCVGEHERDAHGTYLKWLENQIVASLQGIPKKHIQDVIIAYEPIWAIGKSADEAMTPDTLFEMGLFIKKVITKHFGPKAGDTFKLLYGGSVEPRNDDALMNTDVIDGFLVGHASLDPESFYEVVTTH